MFGFYGFDFVDDEAEAIAHVDDGCVDGGTCGGVEDETNGVGFAAYAEGMDLAGHGAIGDRFTDLEHMGAEDHLVTRFEMIGIIFHERIAAGETAAHGLHGADESGCLPIPFTAESKAMGHESLRGDAG